MLGPNADMGEGYLKFKNVQNLRFLMAIISNQHHRGKDLIVP